VSFQVSAKRAQPAEVTAFAGREAIDRPSPRSTFGARFPPKTDQKSAFDSVTRHTLSIAGGRLAAV
jgi:hypothetical protein